MVKNKTFWKKKKVLITGHTGFKGTWLSLWLNLLGAKVSGYSLKPNKDQIFFKQVYQKINFENNIYGDITNKIKLKKAIDLVDPEIIIHLAAQSLVAESYENPVRTYETNINGTLNLLNLIRSSKKIRVVLNVTSDKCYLNKEEGNSFVETDPLGGIDPYSSSKACSELVTLSYYNSFLKDKKIGIATARAGNVIGGGDWSNNRLIPDLLKNIINKKQILIRSPNAKRPWQHVLEPLSGYIALCEYLYLKPDSYSGAWNFGPSAKSNISVINIVNKFINIWNKKLKIKKQTKIKFYESKLLMLNSDKAYKKLNWISKLDIDKSMKLTLSWYKFWLKKNEMYQYSIDQIKEYEKL